MWHLYFQGLISPEVPAELFQFYIWNDRISCTFRPPVRTHSIGFRKFYARKVKGERVSLSQILACTEFDFVPYKYFKTDKFA